MTGQARISIIITLVIDLSIISCTTSADQAIIESTVQRWSSWWIWWQRLLDPGHSDFYKLMVSGRCISCLPVVTFQTCHFWCWCFFANTKFSSKKFNSLTLVIRPLCEKRLRIMEHGEGWLQMLTFDEVRKRERLVADIDFIQTCPICFYVDQHFEHHHYNILEPCICWLYDDDGCIFI